MYEEELRSHLVMMDSAFSMFSSIKDTENLCWVGVEGAEEVGVEYEGERVLDLWRVGVDGAG